MNYKKQFIEFIIETGALTFGDFTLKSGRISPYFFNASLFNQAQHLSRLGEFYAAAIVDNKLTFDVLFGPAYKGIPLAAATAIALYQKFDINIAYSFNRKEAKNHGEGGNIVGATLDDNNKNKVLIIDDVITAGTAIGEVMEIISHTPAKVQGVIVALDRQERGKNEQSAISEVVKLYQIPVISIINLSDIVDYLKQSDDKLLIAKIDAYRDAYGV